MLPCRQLDGDVDAAASSANSGSSYMSSLSPRDLEVILGPDWKRITAEQENVDTEPTTIEEHRALCERKMRRLADMRFTAVAVVLTGIALVFSGRYASGHMDVEAWVGIAMMA